MKQSSPQAYQLILSSDVPEAVDKDFLQKTFTTTLHTLNWSIDGSIALAFVTQQESQQLNMTYAHNNYPTDVLSFVYNDSVGPTNKNNQKIVGEIAICTEIAKQQADAYEVSTQSEIILLLIHGLMHLHGLDHQDSGSQASFEHMQNGIMESLKLEYHSMPW